MKIKFRETTLGAAKRSQMIKINEIIEDYQNQGYRLSLRQLYYQLVQQNIIANKQSEYAKLSGILKEGRMAGIIDWDAIEDRLRKPSSPNGWESPKSIINAVVNQYQKRRQEGQENYIEVWVEKDALSGVLKTVTEPFHIPILVNRGYSSVTSMHDSYNRFKDAFENNQKVVVLYIGDHDPSGLDMIRDITDRTLEFITGSEFIQEIWHELDYDFREDLIQGIRRRTDENDHYVLEEVARDIWVKENWFPANIEFIGIALTTAQVKQYNPPPNPAKITDPRAGEYIKNHGQTSWEVDSLPPRVLNKLLTENIDLLINREKYNAILEQEKKDIIKLKDLANKL